ICVLVNQLPFAVPLTVGPDRSAPKAEFCFGASNPDRNGEAYTVLWLASSDVMCTDLANQLAPRTPVPAGIPLTATVRGATQVNVRADASTKAAIIGQVSDGATGTVSCYQDGETVVVHPRGTSNLWDKVRIGGLDGYIADVLLDTDGDLATQSHACPRLSR